MKRPLNDFSTDPIYTINTVTQRTGVTANTLRAWETRYQLVKPTYRRGGHPLYSEQDVALLGWVRQQLLTGLTIRRVASLLAEKRATNEILWVETAQPTAQRQRPQVAAPANLIRPLYNALTTLEISRCNQMLTQAFFSYDVSEVCIQLILPTRQRIEQAVEQGHVHPAHNRLIDRFLRSTLAGQLWDLPRHQQAPRLYIGCAPGDTDEIEALVLALIAAQRGYEVFYLGPDISIDLFCDLPTPDDFPDIIVLLASLPAAALQLADMQPTILANNSQPIYFGFGGRAFDANADLREQIAGVYLGPEPGGWVTTLDGLLANAEESDLS